MRDRHRRVPISQCFRLCIRLGLCPENKISGGKVLYTKSRRVTSRVATALRMAANSLRHAKDYLGEFFRRITRKLGKPQAITATAHKLARIVYHLLSTKEAYNETVFHRCDEEALRRAQFRLRRQTAQLGFQVIPHRTGDVPWESALLRLSSRAARRSAGISAL
jgi:transposase